MSIDLLLIHPPVVRPSEPPLGVACLANFLRDQGLGVAILDLNVEVFNELLRPEDAPPPDDPFSKRALRQLPTALRELRSPDILRRPSRYRSIISQLNRTLWLKSGKGQGPRVSLTNYRHPSLSPLSIRDLHHMIVNRETGCLRPFIEQRTLHLVEELNPRFVGISVNFLSQALPAMALVGALRNAFQKLRILVGGGLITTWGDRISQNPPLNAYVNEWIAGPGETPLSGILGKKAKKGPGPSYPSFEGIPWSMYLSPERILPLAISKGCYWGKCLFCQESISGATYEPSRLCELSRVIEETMDQNEVRWIHFTDNAIPPEVLRVLSHTKSEALWFGFARFERSLKDSHLVRRLHRSGCRMLQLGLESGSQRLLDAIGKGIRLEDVSHVLKALHQEGIATYVYVMFGMPGESPDEAKRTLEFVVEHGRWIDYLSCAILNLPREFQNMEDLETFPFQGHGDELGLYTDFRSPYGIDRKEARRFLEKEFRRDPCIAEILKRTPPVFTSNHAPLFFNARQAQGGL